MLKQNRSYKRPLWVAFLLILMGSVGCSGSGERLWLGASGWSRAELVTITQDDDAMALVAVADQLLLLTFEDNQPLLTAYDYEMTPLWQTSITDGVDLVTEATLLLNEQASVVHLFWQVDEALFSRAIDQNGRWLDEAPQLLSGGHVVEQYTTAVDQSGGVHVWWSGSHREPGVYALTLDNPTPELMAADGRRPVIFVDETNTLHAAWFVRQSVIQEVPVGYYYAAYSNAQISKTTAQLIAETQIYTDSIFDGPFMAADQSGLYILWSELIRSGRATGIAENHYLYLDHGGFTAPLEVQTVKIPSIYVQSDAVYEPWSADGGFATAERVLIGSETFNGLGEQLQGMNVVQQGGSEVALAFRASVLKERIDIRQVVVVFLENGRVSSYQLLTDTFYSSFNPQLAAIKTNQPDEAEYLWLGWAERLDNNQFAVYLASTHPTTVNSLAGIQWSDISRLSLTTLFGLFLNAVLTPFVFLVWMIPVLLVLFLTMPLWRRADQLNPKGWGALAVVLITFWAVKLLTMQGMFAYVPFSQWIPWIPAWVGILIQLVVLLGVPYMAGRLAWRYGRESDFQPVLAISLIYSLVDTLGTMTFYGELLYNAF